MNKIMKKTQKHSTIRKKRFLFISSYVQLVQTTPPTEVFQHFFQAGQHDFRGVRIFLLKRAEWLSAVPYTV